MDKLKLHGLDLYSEFKRFIFALVLVLLIYAQELHQAPGSAVIFLGAFSEFTVKFRG